MHKTTAIAVLLALAASVAGLTSADLGAAEAEPKAGPVRVVILVGGHGYDQKSFEKAWGGHDDIRCEVWKGQPYTVFDDIAKFKYDAILMYNLSSGITDKQKANFLKLLEKGTGLVVWHHALANCQNWPEFEKIAGCKFWMRAGKRGGKEIGRSGTGHALLKMHVADTKHPITKGLKDFEIQDETYNKQTFTKDIHVLLTCDHPKSDKAIAWVHTYGGARVFGYQGGHDAKAWTNPGHRQLLGNGIRWVAGRIGAKAAATPAKGKWIQLFNGKDLTGWKVKITGHKLGDNFGNTFRVVDGVLKVSYDKYEKFGGKFGHLFYEKPFSNYRLRAEYRFTGEQVKGGAGWAWRNSGFMIHGQSPESMRKDQNFPVSIEVQLLGGREKGKRPTGNLCTPGTNVVMDGKLITRHVINSSSDTCRGDRWVTVEVEARGNTIKHIVEGKTVLVYTDPQLDERDRDAKAMMAAGAKKMLTGGSISLQSESHPLEFRKIELMVLED